MAKFLLSAFADEAGGGLLSQIRALKENGMTHIEPSGLDYGNIADYTEADCREMRMILDYHGIGVSAIGSPFGKINIEDDFEPHFEKFKRGVEMQTFSEPKTSECSVSSSMKIRTPKITEMKCLHVWNAFVTIP